MENWTQKGRTQISRSLNAQELRIRNTQTTPAHKGTRAPTSYRDQRSLVGHRDQLVKKSSHNAAERFKHTSIAELGGAQRTKRKHEPFGESWNHGQKP